MFGGFFRLFFAFSISELVFLYVLMQPSDTRCQSVKVKVSNCISAYVDMRHFIWLIIMYNILYIIIILYILLFIIIFITFTYKFQLNNPPFKETVKSHPSLIKCKSEFDTLTLTL